MSNVLSSRRTQRTRCEPFLVHIVSSHSTLIERSSLIIYAPALVYVEEPNGQGADLSFASCLGSFDGEAACGVNGTVFVNGHAGNMGGAVSLLGGDDPWHVEFHRCKVASSSAGRGFEHDPQGQGGAFSVGVGVALLLSDCLFMDNTSGNKVGLLCESAFH